MIELDDVFVVYRGADADVAALRGLSLTIATGERVVIRGPSGSGKSTLVRVLAGEQKISAGRATVLGQDVGRGDHQRLRQWRQHAIGTITQSDGERLLGELSCLDNVMLQARLAGWSATRSESEARQVMERLGIAHIASQTPGKISGGERQRVALAAALCLRPQMIIADEPAGELDALTAGEMYRMLAESVHETDGILLIVAHDEAAEAVADRVLTIRDGRLGEQRGRGEHEARAVVDARGWMRLGDGLRRSAGIGETVRVSATGEGLLLHGDPALVDNGKADAPGAAAETANQETAIAVRDVSVTVDGRNVLDEVSAEIRTGALTAIVGRSGSGKTTLLSVIAGYRTATSGTVEHLVDLGQAAVVPRDPGFADSATVDENIALSVATRRVPGLPVEPIAAVVGLVSLLDRRAAHLSGGERQRSAVLRAAVANPRLLIADEPTSQLDEVNAAAVVAVLRAVARSGAAVVVASHDPQVVAAADVVIQLG